VWLFKTQMQGGGLGKKKWKLSSGGSVSGTPVKTNGAGNGGGRWNVGNEVVVVVYVAVQKCEQRWVFGQTIGNRAVVAQS
jgi:hypothetical protein